MWNIYKDLTRPHHYERWFGRNFQLWLGPQENISIYDFFQKVWAKFKAIVTYFPPPHFLYESGCTCFPSCGMHITWIGMKSESGFNESFFYLNGMPRSKSLSHSILFCHVGRCKMRTVCWKAWLVSQRSDTTGWNFWRIKSFGLHDFKRNPGPSKKVISQKHMKIRYCRYRDA